MVIIGGRGIMADFRRFSTNIATSMSTAADGGGNRGCALRGGVGDMSMLCTLSCVGSVPVYYGGCTGVCRFATL